MFRNKLYLNNMLSLFLRWILEFFALLASRSDRVKKARCDIGVAAAGTTISPLRWPIEVRKG